MRKTEDAGLKLPGVAVDRGNVPASAPPAPAPPPPVTQPAPAPAAEVRYRLSQLGAAQNSVSVPLRPFTRQVPREIEKAFAGRSVYSLLVPMAGMDAYRGDWVVWFGERVPTADGRVSAPLPQAQKVAPKAGTGPVTESRIRAHFVVGTDGSVSGVTISSSSESSLAVRAAEDLKLWRFRPAAKNGSPFEADVVLEYWFRVSWQ